MGRRALLPSKSAPPAAPACGKTCAAYGGASCDQLRDTAQLFGDGYSFTCSFLENKGGCTACSPSADSPGCCVPTTAAEKSSCDGGKFGCPRACVQEVSDGTSTTTQCRCSDTTAATTSDETCLPCPLGVTCGTSGTNLATLPLDPGFWRISLASTDIRRCPDGHKANETACVGSAASELGCRANHAGIYCRECVDNTSYLNPVTSTCEPCEASGPSTTLIAISTSAVVVPDRRSRQRRVSVVRMNSDGGFEHVEPRTSVRPPPPAKVDLTDSEPESEPESKESAPAEAPPADALTPLSSKAAGKQPIPPSQLPSFKGRPRFVAAAGAVAIGSGKKVITRHDPNELREASKSDRLEQARAKTFEAHSRFSVYVPTGSSASTDGDDEERKTSAPAKLKSRKDSLAGLTKEERLAKRKASMTAGDSWADLHGTKDRPPKQFEREEQRLKYETLEAAREVERAAAEERATAAERAAADGAGPSSYGEVDIEQPLDETFTQRV